MKIRLAFLLLAVFLFKIISLESYFTGSSGNGIQITNCESSKKVFNDIYLINSNNEIIIDYAKFGVMEKRIYGKWRFRETNHVPKRIGTYYQWYIHICTDKEKVTWKEEFTLPEPPTSWAGEATKEVIISSDRKTAITEKTVLTKDGWISHGWSVAKGDPAGTYNIKIFIEGKYVKEFLFIVD